MPSTEEPITHSHGKTRMLTRRVARFMPALHVVGTKQ